MNTKKTTDYKAKFNKPDTVTQEIRLKLLTKKIRIYGRLLGNKTANPILIALPGEKWHLPKNK